MMVFDVPPCVFLECIVSIFLNALNVFILHYGNIMQSIKQTINQSLSINY